MNDIVQYKQEMGHHSQYTNIKSAILGWCMAGGINCSQVMN